MCVAPASIAATQSTISSSVAVATASQPKPAAAEPEPSSSVAVATASQPKPAAAEPEPSSFVAAATNTAGLMLQPVPRGR